MHARAGDAELIPWSWIVHHCFLSVRDTEGEMLSRWWLATVYDTDCLQPLGLTHGCSLWSEQRQLLAPLLPRHLWVRHCRCCDRLPVAPSRAPLARCRWLRPRHLACEAPRLCLVETVLPLQKTFCFCETLTLLHLVPIDEAPASGSMLRAVCVLCGCVHE